jgi:hypothetical protein
MNQGLLELSSECWEWQWCGAWVAHTIDTLSRAVRCWFVKLNFDVWRARLMTPVVRGLTASCLFVGGGGEIKASIIK